MVFVEESSEENLSCVLTTKFSVLILHLDKPDAFWKQIKIELIGFGVEWGRVDSIKFQQFCKQT